VSGAQAAALAAGCCCTAGGDGGGGAGDCPQILNNQPRTPADSVIDTVSVSLSLTSVVVATNVGNSLGNSCEVEPAQTYPEQALASVGGGSLQWTGADWSGCGSGGASVTPLQHGITRRICGGSICPCTGNSPGCWQVPCCGDIHTVPRLHAVPFGFVSYNQSEVIVPASVACPACCGGAAVIDTGGNVASWEARASFVIRYGCLHLPDWEVARPCNCPASDFATEYGYHLLVRVQIYSAGRLADFPTACAPTAIIQSPNSAVYGQHVAWYSKPCCNASDSVRGTYTLMHAESSSGTTGLPAYSWTTTRSATAQVS
jgi:hypothetical protein